MTAVLITGANRGIGLELVRHYAGLGAEVHACCRNPEEARELQAVKGSVTMHALDVTNDAGVQALASDISGPLDVVIANAGIYGEKGDAQNFGSLDFGAMRDTFEVNTIGALRTLKAFSGHAKNADHGKLVAITSKMGSIDDASGGSIAYRTSKTALNMGLCCAANELESDGVAVAALHPGWVRTDMGGPNGNISPEESAKGLAGVIDGLSPGPKAAFKDYSGQAINW